MDSINPSDVTVDQPISSSDVTVDQPIQDSDVKLDTPKGGLSPDDITIDSEKPASNAPAYLEGFARSITGGLSDIALKGARELAEKYTSNPDFYAPKMEDVKERSESPAGHLAEAVGIGAGLLTGAGVPGAIAKVAPEVEIAGKLGNAMIRNGVQMGLFQTGDEISNAILGKGDKQAPVSSAIAHIGAATLLGASTGGLFNIIGQGGNKGLQAIENSKMGAKAKSMILGMGVSERIKDLGLSPEQATEYIENLTSSGDIKAKDIKAGMDLYKSSVKNFSTAAGGGIGGTIAGGIGGIFGGWPGGTTAAAAGERIGEKVFTPMVERIIGKQLNKSNKYVFPAVMKCISEGNTDGLFQALDYGNKVSKGAAKISNAIDGLFKVGGTQLMSYEASPKDREKLNEFIEEGGGDQQIRNQINEETQQPQGFAKGGQVLHKIPKNPDIPKEPDHFANVFPDQAMGLSTAKSRVYNYLKQIRPQQEMKLPYDKHEPDPIKRRSYNEALDFANQPLKIINHIKDGTILPEHVKHLNTMYPELYDHLSKKITERISHNQVDEERPSYKTRQGLSLFLAKPLDSSFTPQSIIAAQMGFMPKQPPQQPPGNTKRGTSTLGKNNKTYKTADQAAESDRTARD